MERFEEIEEGIANRNIKKLREAVGDICFTSRDFSSGLFDEAIAHIESKGIQLKDDGLIGDPPISSIKKEYTDDDFADAVFELQENFCDERIRDVKTIGKALYGNRPKEPSVSPNEREARQLRGTDPNAKSHQKTDSSPLVAIVKWVMSHPIKAAIILVLIIAVIALYMKHM